VGFDEIKSVEAKDALKQLNEFTFILSPLVDGLPLHSSSTAFWHALLPKVKSKSRSHERLFLLHFPFLHKSIPSSITEQFML
jgi:hypothetical protein